MNRRYLIRSMAVLPVLGLLIVRCQCPGRIGGSDGGAGADAAAGADAGGSSSSDVLQHHKNATRDGFYVDPLLTKAAIPGMHVDTGFSATTDGDTYSQPLYLTNGVGGAPTLFVATEGDTVYAFDAATGATLWTKSLGTPLPGGLCGGSIWPLGTTGTPVIDTASRTLFVAAMVRGGAAGATAPTQMVYALSVDTGSILWKVDVGATISGFDSTIQNQRGALTFLNGAVYVPYGGLDGDCGNYHGWVVGVPAGNPTGASGWSTVATSGPGIWGPSGVASDGTSLYVATGNTNGPFPTQWNKANSEAVIKLGPGPIFNYAGANYFAGTNWFGQDTSDADLGSSGVVLLDVPGANPGQLAFAIGKTQNAYLLNRANLGGINDGLSTPLLTSSNQVFGSLFAYATAGASYVGMQQQLQGCNNGNADFSVLKVSAGSPPQLSFAWCANGGGPGSPIASTSGGLQDVVVWTYGAGGDETLRAYDGDTGGTPLYTSSSPAVPGFSSVHWISPMIAAGRVYVAGSRSVIALTVR